MPHAGKRCCPAQSSCGSAPAESNRGKASQQEQTDDEPLLPDHICENEAERHEWRANVLSFIRDHVDIKETYRLGADDLAFGELLPDKPGWLDQEEYEERTKVGFQLERLTKTAAEMTAAHFAFAARSNLDEA